MPGWVLKAIVQKTISLLPASQKINFFFQKYVTRGVHLTDAYFEDKLIHAFRHLGYFREYTGRNSPESFLELGTGWYPVVPMAFWISGSSRLHTADIVPLMNNERFIATLEKFSRWYAMGNLQRYINAKPERIQFLQSFLKNNLRSESLEQWLSVFHIHYHVQDASSLYIEPVEAIVSNNTLEHIYPEYLIPILKNLYFNLLSENGIMSHFIDMSDHFAHNDSSITIYNFLKFSPAKWKWIDNSVQPQNRLRLKQYKEIFHSLNIPLEVKEFRKGNPEIFKSLKVDACFTGLSAEELAISHAYVVSRKEK